MIGSRRSSSRPRDSGAVSTKAGVDDSAGLSELERMAGGGDGSGKECRCGWGLKMFLGVLPEERDLVLKTTLFTSSIPLM